MSGDCYRSGLERIAKAQNLSSLAGLIRSFTRVYDSGHLTPSEYGSLDVKIMEKLAILNLKKAREEAEQKITTKEIEEGFKSLREFR